MTELKQDWSRTDNPALILTLIKPGQNINFCRIEIADKSCAKDKKLKVAQREKNSTQKIEFLLFRHCLWMLKVNWRKKLSVFYKKR